MVDGWLHWPWPIIFHIQDYTTLALFEIRSNYIGAGGQNADTCLQVLIVPTGRFSENASSTIRLTAALDGRMLTEIRKLVSHMAGNECVSNR